MIRLGTVGTSSICEHFLDGVALTARFTHAAVYSRNEETGKAFAEKHGCERVFCSLYEMAKSGEIDAVYIASPNVFHKEQSRIFLENGIHVICEKPIVTEVKHYKELKALADENKLIFMEAIIPRYVAAYGKVKEAVAKIGKIQMARIDFCQRSSRLDSFLAGEHINIFDMSLLAGCFNDIGVYCVYAALDLLGEPISVKADKVLLYNGADGSGSAILNYGDFVASLTYSKTCDGAICSEIIGEKGTVKIEKISQYAGVTLISDGKVQQISGIPNKAQLMSGEAERFADYIENLEEYRAEYEKTSDLCLKVHKTMELIKDSAGLEYPEK